MIQHGLLPWPTPAELGTAATEVYSAITKGPRAAGPQHFRLSDPQGRLEGPFNAMVLAPSVGGRSSNSELLSDTGPAFQIASVKWQFLHWRRLKPANSSGTRMRPLPGLAAWPTKILRQSTAAAMLPGLTTPSNSSYEQHAN